MNALKPILSFSRIALALLALGLLAGCATYRDSTREIALQQTLKAYENTMRWGDLSKLGAFLSSELKTEEGTPPNYENIRVVQYRVTHPALMSEEGRVAVAKARIAYVLQDRQVERALIDEQRWEFDEELSEWRRTTPLPKFK